MEKLILKTVSESLVFENRPEIFSGDIGSVTLKVNFDETWDGFGKTAVFSKGTETPVFKVLDINGECIIPSEILADPGKIYLGVFGVKDEKTITSELIGFKIGKGVDSFSAVNPKDEPEPDVYQQIVSNYGKVIQAINQEIADRKSAVSGVEDEVSDLSDKVPFGFGIDVDSNYGYLDSTGKVVPFSSGIQVTISAQGNPVNVLVPKSGKAYLDITVKKISGSLYSYTLTVKHNDDVILTKVYDGDAGLYKLPIEMDVTKDDTITITGSDPYGNLTSFLSMYIMGQTPGTGEPVYNDVLKRLGEVEEEAKDASDTAKSFQGQIIEVKEDIAQVANATTDITSTEVEEDVDTILREGFPKISNGKIAFQISGERATLYCDVLEGEKYHIICSYYHQTTQIGYAITDADGNVLESYYDENAIAWMIDKPFDITIPSNGAILYVHQMSNAHVASVKKIVEKTEYTSKSYSKEEVDSKFASIDNIFSKLGLDKSLKLVSYKPLGVLSKGYICLSCDDGAEALATVTIPKLKEMKQTYGKNIPMTFALMTSSHVLKYEEQKSLVMEMLNSYGCSVAIHGSASYTTYTDDDLIAFLDEQKEQLTELCGVAPSSIIFPNHDYNEKTATIAGSYFGVCGTGGSNRPIYYSSYTAGERSNMYTLYRVSLLGGSGSFNTVQKKKDQIKEMIDYCVENHKICLPFFHDSSLVSDGTYFTAEECMEIFEYCVSYAVSVGITFCTFGQIPTLI